ncbi:hypothetical protein ACEPAI_2096 [Sanghuangporus weigelae]
MATPQLSCHPPARAFASPPLSALAHIINMQLKSNNAYILENTVFHARHIPISSRHVFTYPTLALLLRLTALESQALDLCAGRLFGYSPAGSPAPWARVVGVRPEAYLHDPTSYFEGSVKAKSVREKLDEVLMRFGIDPREMVDVWMLTMPRYLGVEGINPLTVYYCYKKKRRGGEGESALWVVVLEVHNTFGERHVYVLRTGPEHEDKQVVPGYAHSWTFPRQFHVSPFNDRSGFYTCSLVPPPPPSSSTSPPASPSSSSLPKILIQLYTPENELKLTASLRAGSAVPLNTHNLLAALAKYPFTLLLSFPRIVWQAFHLHYALKLDVYARPEPRAVDAALESLLFSEGLVKDTEVRVVRNDVQRKDGELGVGGGLGWQPEGLLERFARRRVERFLRIRASEAGVKVRLVSTNPGYGTKVYVLTSSATTTECEQELTILTRSARAFLLILASPSLAHALLLVRDAERLMSVSDEKLFLEVFSFPSSQGLKSQEGRDNTINTNIVECTLQSLRKLPIPNALLHDPELPMPGIHPLDIDIDIASTDSQRQHHHPPQAFLPQNSITSLQTLAVLTAFLALTFLEKALFSVLGARFVRGTEPWGMWERAEGVWTARRKGRRTEGRTRSDEVNM